MTEDRQTWVGCAATLAAARPDYLARLVAEAERDGPAREAVLLAAEYLIEDDKPLPADLGAFLLRGARRELPALTTGPSPADRAFRNLALARRVRRLTERVRLRRPDLGGKTTVVRHVAKRTGMTEGAMWEAIKGIRSLGS